MPKYYYIEIWKWSKVSKWSNLKLFSRLPRLLRRGDEREELALCCKGVHIFDVHPALSLTCLLNKTDRQTSSGLQKATHDSTVG